MAMLKIIVFLLLTGTAFGADYSPFVKITIEKDGLIKGGVSGTVIKSGETIDIITCSHILRADKAAKECNVYFFDNFNGVTDTQLSVKAKFSIVKNDEDIDLLLLSGKNILQIDVEPIDVAKTLLLPKTIAKVNGYPGLSTALTSNDAVVVSYTELATSKTHSQILTCKADVQDGMSGGGLTYKNLLHGTLSSDGESTASFCPADQILQFLESK